MGDPIINAEIRNYLEKEIGVKTRELETKIQNLTLIIDKQQKVIETLQKKAVNHENIFSKCLCDTCENKLTCEWKLW